MVHWPSGSSKDRHPLEWCLLITILGWQRCRKGALAIFRVLLWRMDQWSGFSGKSTNRKHIRKPWVSRHHHHHPFHITDLEWDSRDFLKILPWANSDGILGVEPLELLPFGATLCHCSCHLRDTALGLCCSKLPRQAADHTYIYITSICTYKYSQFYIHICLSNVIYI